MPAVLIRQIRREELSAYEAAGWERWPPPELRRADSRLTERDDPLVALRVPRHLSHQELMQISAEPLKGLGAVAAAKGGRA